MIVLKMSNDMTKPTNWLCTQRTQISLCIRPVWSVFAVRMKKAWVLSDPLSAQRRLIRLGGCPGWSESSLGAQSLCWFCHNAAQIYRWCSTRTYQIIAKSFCRIVQYIVHRSLAKYTEHKKKRNISKTIYFFRFWWNFTIGRVSSALMEKVGKN